MLDGGVDVAHGCEVEVGDVHADLCAAVGDDADSFDAVETAVGGADVAGDGASGGDVGSFEVNVVGDEEAAGSDGAGSGGLVKLGAADVGAAGGGAAARGARGALEEVARGLRADDASSAR